MLILDLCSGTGAWSRPYKDNGFKVLRIDVKNGIDVRLFKKVPYVYGVLCAPPCTHLSASGARWWDEKGEVALIEALSIVDACLRIVLIHKPKFWCLENPVGRLSNYLGKPAYTFHPNDYARYSDDPITNEYSKRTCLWGKFNIPPMKRGLMRNKNYINYISPSKNRSEQRSITPNGFANAFYLYNH